MLFKKMPKLFVDCSLNKAAYLRISQPNLCLSLKMRVDKLHRYNRSQPLTQIIAAGGLTVL